MFLNRFRRDNDSKITYNIYDMVNAPFTEPAPLTK